MWQSLPEFGTAALLAVMVAAAYTFAVAVAAGGSGRPRLLQAARLGAYGTVALIGVATLCLAYAFVTHDFRIRYVVRYSDRSMTTGYLIAALWGGQDGSLLWWLMLLGAYTAACVRWVRGKYRELQPWVIATLMLVTLFFAVTMTFAANPFATSVAGARPDGEGLNPLLQNFYMTIHPPALYAGFVGCAVPFAFAVAALVTGRLDNEWTIATRKWMLFAWLFLSIGNALGMLWAYEELGWGGYWAWDPVENAAVLPWFTASAYVHSTMIQERRGMLKIWNVFLIASTFFLTIFGTFLTRSGLIASVHSFAQSNIGVYFLWFMAVIVAGTLGLVVWRLPRLRSEGVVESALSREMAFLLNNWGLLGVAVFVLVATIFPRISEWLLRQQSTVGPAFYNAWLPPLALAVFALMGAAPLLGWRKTSPQLFWRGFLWPVGTGLVFVALHVAFGRRLGFPAHVVPERIYDGPTGIALQKVGGVLPAVAVFLVAFNLAVVVQEYVRGVAARRRAHDEGVLAALYNLVGKARRRHGGYVVHAGIALLFLGFTGRAWGIDAEAVLGPGQSMRVDRYQLTYTGPRSEADPTKRMVFADVTVKDASGRDVGAAHPAKFVYRRAPDSPTTEVSMIRSLRDDLYVVVGSVNQETRTASFQVHVNPLVSWVWIGLAILVLGAVVCMWPEVALAEAGAWGWLRAAGSVGTAVMLGVLLALLPSRALGQQSSSLHAGSVQIDDPKEKELFGRLLCQCGDCARLPLSTCTCSWAENARADIRARMRAGDPADAIVADFVREHGSKSLAVPPDQGGLRTIYLVPIAAAAAGAGLLFVVARRWRRRGAAALVASPAGAADAAGAPPSEAEWDARLDDELRRLDER